MKHLTAVSLMTLLPSLATAHDTGVPHAHPHTDWSVMLVLAAVVAVAVFVVLRRQSSNKDD